MDHKDLLDSVVNNMAAATNNIPSQPPTQEAIDNCIKLELSTGDTFLVDVSTFDWVNAIGHIDQMTENENAFMNMMRGCINPSDDDEYNEWLKQMIVNLTDYLKGYEIEVDYKAMNPDITDREIVMLLAFDANNITRTMKYHVMKFMYDTGYDRDYTSITDEDPLKDWIESLSTEPVENPEQLWKVTVHCDDLGNFETTEIEKVDYCDKDEYMVVCSSGNDISVVVTASNEREAWDISESMFNDTYESSDIITEELCNRDMDDDEPYSESDDGEPFDPTEFGFTRSEVIRASEDFMTTMKNFIAAVLTPEEMDYIIGADDKEAYSGTDEKLNKIIEKLNMAGYEEKINEATQALRNIDFSILTDKKEAITDETDKT